MSDIHVLTAEHNRFRCAFHIPVPSTNNAVGTPWRSALVNSGLGGMTGLVLGTGPGQINAAELAEIQSGAVYEVIEEILLEDGAPPVQLLDNAYARVRARALIDLQAALRRFGATRNVP